MNGSVGRILRSFGNGGPNWVEIDVGHAGDNSGLIEEADRSKTPFPKVSGAVVFPVRPAGDFFGTDTISCEQRLS